MSKVCETVCPMCRTYFKVGPDTLRSRRTETLTRGVYREYFNLECPGCSSQVILTKQYEVSYLEAACHRADGTVRFGVYPDMDGSVDRALWKELPKEARGMYCWVKDRCTHEDYPCCGCSAEPYLMDKDDAERLAEKKKVRILGEYDPMKEMI